MIVAVRGPSSISAISPKCVARARASRAPRRARSRLASPSPITKKPTPPWPSSATCRPASNVRSLNDGAIVSSSRCVEARRRAGPSSGARRSERHQRRGFYTARSRLRAWCASTRSRELLDPALGPRRAARGRACRAPRRAPRARSPRRAATCPLSSRSTICSELLLGLLEGRASLTAPPRRARRSRRSASSTSTRVAGRDLGAERTIASSAADDRVAALERRAAARARAAGGRVARAQRAGARRARRGARPSARALRRPRPLDGEPRARRSRARASVARAALERGGRACEGRARRSSRARSSARSGTTSRAAAVGVEARTSAARSQSGVSCSWPTA